MNFRTLRIAIFIAMMSLSSAPKLSAANAIASHERAMATGINTDAHPASGRDGFGSNQTAATPPLLSPLMVALLGSISLGAAVIGCLAIGGRNRRLADAACILLVVCGVLGLLTLTLMIIQPSPA